MIRNMWMTLAPGDVMGRTFPRMICIQVLQLADQLGTPSARSSLDTTWRNPCGCWGASRRQKPQMTALIPDELRLNEPTSPTDLAEAYAGDTHRAWRSLGPSSCSGRPTECVKALEP